MVVSVVVALIKMSMGKLLRNTPEDILGFKPRSYEKLFVLRAIEGVNAVRQIVAYLHNTGGIIDNRLQEQTIIVLYARSFLRGRIGLGNIKHLFRVVAHTDSSVLLGVFLSGFKKNNAAFAFFDENIAVLPALEIGKLFGIGLLRRDEQCVTDGIWLEGQKGDGE